MSTFSDADIKKIADLAKLLIKDDDFPLYQKNLSSILDLVQEMDLVDTSQISAMAHPFTLKQPLRPDEVTEPSSDELLRIAPATEADLFLVPKVIEKEKS